MSLLEVYTDGGASPNPGEGGIGVVLLFKSHRLDLWEYFDYATNNFLELKAIHIALQHIKHKDIPVVIYSDSLYAVSIITDKKKAKVNLDLIHQIKSEISKFTNLTITKIKGHNGNEYNEYADYLCSFARINKCGGEKRY